MHPVSGPSTLAPQHAQTMPKALFECLHCIRDPKNLDVVFGNQTNSGIRMMTLKVVDRELYDCEVNFHSFNDYEMFKREAQVTMDCMLTNHLPELKLSLRYTDRGRYNELMKYLQSSHEFNRLGECGMDEFIKFYNDCVIMARL